MSDLTTISTQLDDVLAQIAAQREELARREAAMAAQAEQLSRDAAVRAAYAQGRHDGINTCCQALHLRLHELPRSNARTVGRSLLSSLEALRDAT